jgi:hypothetical protein
MQGALHCEVEEEGADAYPPLIKGDRLQAAERNKRRAVAARSKQEGEEHNLVAQARYPPTLRVPDLTGRRL